MTNVDKTTNFEMFKLYEENRQLDEVHVQALMRSVQGRNLLHLAPIIVNADYYVVDGQHRLEVAKRLNTPIYYLKDEGVGMKDVSTLNWNMVRWSVNDFVSSYALRARKGEKQYADYEELKTFCIEHGISVTVGAGLMMGMRTSKNISFFRLLREGRFHITHYKEAEAVVKAMMKLAPILSMRVYGSIGFTNTLMKLINEFGVKKVIDTLLSKGKMIQKAQTLAAYEDQIAEITNGELVIGKAK